MDIQLAPGSFNVYRPCIESRRALFGKAAIFADRLTGAFRKMSERGGRFTLSDADTLAEKLLYAYPREVEWSLSLQEHDRSKPPGGFNARLSVALRDLRRPWAWRAAFYLYFDSEAEAGRDVIRRIHTEISLSAYDADGWLGMTSVLDHQPVAAEQGKVELAFDKEREHEILDWAFAAAC
jgi:hypothetical protein